MVVPYANRAGVATLPALALASKPASGKEIIEDFAKQCPHETALECVQLIKGRTLRVIFPSAIIMEDITSGGLTFRSHPLQFKTPSVSKMVTLLDLPYGIPESEIKTVLSKFGQVAYIRAETYMGLYTGTRLIKMDVKTAIPSRVTVAGHLCTVFYRGQVRSCFRCGLAGHEAKSCPRRQTAPPGGSVPPSQEEPPSRHGERMSTTPPSSPRTFAEVVASPRVAQPPSVHVSPAVPVDSGSQPEGSGEVVPPKVDTTAKPPPIRRVPQPVETVERDRSPLTMTSSSQSDSSGGVSPPKTTATTHPPRPPSDERGERDRSPIRPRRARAPLDRRPVSTRTRELRVGDSSLSEEEIATEVERIERAEQQLHAKKKKRRESAALKLQHGQLLLDHAFASRAYMAKQSSNEDTTEIAEFLIYAKEALDAFAVEHPEMAGTSK